MIGQLTYNRFLVSFADCLKAQVPRGMTEVHARIDYSTSSEEGILSQTSGKLVSCVRGPLRISHWMDASHQAICEVMRGTLNIDEIFGVEYHWPVIVHTHNCAN